MADPASYGNPDRDIEQALIALKKGTQLIKYCRKGKPKFRAFRLSPDETALIWYSHGAEKHLKLSSVSRIIPGQRTPVFKRFLRPDKEYLSFSLIYHDGERSLDLICKDKLESELWLAGLKALISTGQSHNRRTRSELPDSHVFGDFSQDSHRPYGAKLESSSSISNRVSSASSSHVGSEIMSRPSGADGSNFRISVSSTPSCSSQGSGPDDIESLGDVYMWGEIWSDGVPDGTSNAAIPIKLDALIPKILEANVVLDVLQIACGVRHIALVTRQGEVFTWGEESGGRLGHGIEKDFSSPKLVDFLAITNVESVSCGEFHTCAMSASGDLYTWGDGAHNAGLLGHGNDVSHWIPKRVSGSLEGLPVLSVACGSWHSAVVTSTGHLFTFGDGTFGALGHGDRESVPYPKEVGSLNGLKTIAVSCGVWHTAAIIEVTTNQTGHSVSSRKLFTWGDGGKNRLGHGSKETHLLPTCVSALIDYNIHQVACGHDMTVVLTTSGHVFTMGSNDFGQLGNPAADGKLPGLVQDRLVGEYVEQIACGAHHVVVLTSRSEVFTWGKGANGRLGHGDLEDHNVPTLIEALKDRHVKTISCGSNYTASICTHRWVSGADQSVCTACRQPFGFTRKRHNCHNCGMVHCHACSSKKALRAALAPTPGKPHRVCDSCYLKLKRAADVGNAATLTRRASGHRRSMDVSIRPDREGKASRLLLSPTVEPVKYLEVKSGMSSGMRSADNYNIVRASQVPSLLQLKDIAFPSSLSALQFALKPVITPSPQQQQQPQSQSNSRPASPYSSRRPSPPRSAGTVCSRGMVDTLKRSNDVLTQEVNKLQGQIRSLKQKAEAQDTEMQKLKESARQATSLADDRSSKCNRAMQAVKTITDQLKEITEKLPSDVSESESFKVIQTQVESVMDLAVAQESEDGFSSLPPEPTYEQQNNNNNHTSEDQVDSGGPQSADGTPRDNPESCTSHRHRASPSTDGGPDTADQAPRREGQTELIEQFEPGVYVTHIRLSNGTKIFKRVRFSKRRYSSQQAEEWWRENKDRVMRRYSPANNTNTAAVEVAAPQPPAEDEAGSSS